jgi:threonine aldolase
MFFASDNGGPAHPAVMAALARANDGHRMPYGVCDWTDAAVALVREALDAPGAEVHLVTTGTAANALCLAAMSQPWQRIFCSDIAHVLDDEMGAVTFFANGAEMAPVAHTDGRMAPADLFARIAREDPRRRGPVSVTQVTEAGTVHTLGHLAALVAAAGDLPVHLDGARFANAVAALGCTPAAMAAGMTAVSLGGTKNGCLGVEAAVFPDPARAHALWARRKRGGHVLSKTRYLAAQMVGYLEHGLWLETAAQANRKTARLAAALANHPDVTLAHPVDANIVFARWPKGLHDRLRAEGAQYYLMEDGANRPADAPLLCRLVCDWSVEDAAIDRLLSLLHAG